MSKREFDHLSNSSHLFSATTDIIIADIIELFFFLSIDWLALGKEHSVWRDNTEFFRLGCDDLEFNWLEVTSD